MCDLKPIGSSTRAQSFHRLILLSSFPSSSPPPSHRHTSLLFFLLTFVTLRTTSQGFTARRSFLCHLILSPSLVHRIVTIRSRVHRTQKCRPSLLATPLPPTAPLLPTQTQHLPPSSLPMPTLMLQHLSPPSSLPRSVGFLSLSTTPSSTRTQVVFTASSPRSLP